MCQMGRQKLMGHMGQHTLTNQGSETLLPRSELLDETKNKTQALRSLKRNNSEPVRAFILHNLMLPRFLGQGLRDCETHQ
jgi:hypothetical protein